MNLLKQLPQHGQSIWLDGESFRFRHSTATARSRTKAREDALRAKTNEKKAF